MLSPTLIEPLHQDIVLQHPHPSGRPTHAPPTSLQLLTLYQWGSTTTLDLGSSHCSNWLNGWCFWTPTFRTLYTTVILASGHMLWGSSSSRTCLHSSSSWMLLLNLLSLNLYKLHISDAFEILTMAVRLHCFQDRLWNQKYSVSALCVLMWRLTAPFSEYVLSDNSPFWFLVIFV